MDLVSKKGLWSPERNKTKRQACLQLLGDKCEKCGSHEFLVFKQPDDGIYRKTPVVYREIISGSKDYHLVCRVCLTTESLKKRGLFQGGRFGTGTIRDAYNEYQRAEVSKIRCKNRPKYRQSARKDRLKHREARITQNRGLERTYKFRVFEAYSGWPPYCACCGEEAIEFMTIDHINGGGTRHRRKVGQGVRLYKWIIDNNFPTDFRVLCMNCNFALGHFGYCPHGMKAIKSRAQVIKETKEASSVERT